MRRAVAVEHFFRRLLSIAFDQAAMLPGWIPLPRVKLEPTLLTGAVLRVRLSAARNLHVASIPVQCPAKRYLTPSRRSCAPVKLLIQS